MTPNPEEKTRDFIWKTDKNNWHNKRADEMRKKYGQKIAQLEGADPNSIYYFILMSVSHWLVSVAVATYFGDSYWKIAIAGWLLGGYWAVAGGLAMHEAAHQLVFKGRWGSFLAGIVGEMPLFVPAFKTFQHYHLPHHSYVTIEPDERNIRESSMDPSRKPTFDLDLPTRFEAWLFSHSPITRAAFLFL